MRAAVYTRISRDTAGDGAGVDRQEADCRALAARQGWDLTGIYTDNSRSAFTGKARPAWTRLLADAADGHFEAIVAWHDDRLWRNVVEQQTIFALLADSGVTTVATPVRTYATGSADDGFLSGLQALMAQKESADKARRIRRKHEELASEGKPGGGVRPFGYDTDHVTVRSDEADLIRDAATRVISGEGVSVIVAEWNAAGVQTSQGNRWRTSGLRNVLKAPRYAGLREHRGEVVGPAVWDAILSLEQHQRLVALFNSPERRRPGPRRRYLLTGGIAVCGRCDAPLVGQKRQSGQATYACVANPSTGGCGGIRCVAAPLEQLIRDMVIASLDSEGLAAAIGAATGEDQRRADLVDDLHTTQAKLETIEVDHYVNDQLSRPGYLAARRTLTGRLDAIQQDLKRNDGFGVLTDLPADPDQILDRWKPASIDWRRSLVQALVERVVILPAGGRRLFHPDRVKVVWRV